MRIRIYIDTSIVGGIFDDEFAFETKALFERLKSGEIIFVVSSVLKQELKMAPQYVQEVLNKYDSNCFEYVLLTQEAIELADCYIAEKVVGKTCVEDCRHIAIATLNKVDVLVSWNFKHIVNLDKIRGYNSINVKKGYNVIEIKTPRDLINYENN
ncbi:MAG: hypothetical protein LBP59_00910 [Planctomycetaceae bacterium]|jgi:predicted nucleic acid-binding protein|nr:hypothetical protein [Planctomycetaceae bacterium]